MFISLSKHPLGGERLCSPSLRETSQVEFADIPKFIWSLIYTLGPTLLFNLYASWRCLPLRHEHLKVRPNYRGLLKLIITSTLVLLQLIILILEVQAGSNAVYISTAAGAFIGSLLIPYLSLLAHSRKISPFDSLNMLLLLSISVDVAQTAALYLTTESGCKPSAFNMILSIIKVVLLALELKSKRSIVREQWLSTSLENTESIFLETSCCWTNSALRISDDLLPLPKQLSSSILRRKMKTCWESRSRPEGSHALVVATLRCTLRENLCVVPYMLGAICLRYAQPMLMSELILYVSDSPTGDAAWIEVFKLLSATTFVYIGSAIFNGCRDTAKRRVMIAVKGSLIGILHEKTLKCDKDGHSDLTLLINDVENIQTAFGWAHVIWSSFLSLSLGLYLLASRLGWASVVPLVLVWLTSQCGKYASKYFVGKYTAWNAATQVRMGLMKILLEHLKPIKMMGYSHAMETKIQAVRDNEIRAGLVTSWLDIIMAASGSFPNVVSPAISLALYTGLTRMTGEVTFDADLVFTSFALIQMVTLPANSIMFILPEFISAVIGFDRIQRFLLQSDHQDSRKIPEGQVEHFLAYIYPDQHQHRDIIVGPLYPEDGYAIVVNFATVRYNTDDQPVLKNINLKIQTGWLVLVAGLTGSGKTTLAKAILGDVKLQSGSVSTSADNIAFCAQSPWLRDGTIRDIIAGPPGSRVTDEDWYRRVLYACDLNFDLLQLPNKDETLVGGEGNFLSGAQMQQLALARAVYSRLDILILDDVFGSLDTETSSRVMQRLFGPAGLLRELNKTVFLITDSRNLLQHSDLIVILGPNGSICAQGNWNEPEVQACYNNLNLQRQMGLLDEHSKDPPQMNIPRRDWATPGQSFDVLQNPTGNTAHTEYVSAIGRWRSLVTIVIFLSSAAFAMLVQNWLWLWTDDEEPDKRATFYIGVYFALGIGHWASLTGIGTVEFLVVPTSSRALHDQLLSTVIKAPLSLIDSITIETLLSRFSHDMRQLDRKLPREITALGGQTFKLLGQIMLLCMAHTYNLIALPVLLMFLYIIQRIYLTASRQNRRLCMEVSSLPKDSFVETARGISTIRAFGWEDAYALHNSTDLDAAQLPSYTLHALDHWLGLVIDLIVAGLALVNVAIIVTFTGSITAGDVGISMNVILVLNMVLMITVQSETNFSTSLGVISRIRHLEMTVAPESQPTQEHAIPRSWPSCGEITLNNVVSDSYSAGEGTSASDHALTGITFNVSPGHKIAVCGPTGSGKSSLLLAILRMIDLSEGTILIDGLDLSSISRDLIRSRIITIPQESFIIPGDSIRRNLDVEGIATDKKIAATLKTVHLWSSLEFSARDAGLLPTFYLDLPMKALTLSQDQLQLFSLARALLLRSSRGKVVLFEESTTSVDKQTGGIFQQVILEEFQGYTIIVVAHQMKTIVDSDYIIVMDKGRIVESGSLNASQQNEGILKSLLDATVL